MTTQDKIEQERVIFDEEFYSREKQIMILTSNSCGGLGQTGGELLWQASQFYVAYIDCESDELIKQSDRVVWQITNDERESDSPLFSFQPLSIYRLRVRHSKPADETNCKHFLDLGLDIPDFNHRFMLLEVLSGDIIDDRLQQVLNDYNTPVFIEDDQVGKLELNKDLDMYEGAAFWLDKEISIYIHGNDTAKEKLTQLKQLLLQSEMWDKKMRLFCAEKLVELANDWQQDDDESDSLAPITLESFISKISLRELSIDENSEFTAYYDDGDLFWGHVILIEANVDGTLSNANIAG